MTDLFLNEEELRQLTGYKRSNDQAAWLRRNGVRHYRQKSAGRVMVARQTLSTQRESITRDGPRLDFLNVEKHAA